MEPLIRMSYKGEEFVPWNNTWLMTSGILVTKGKIMPGKEKVGFQVPLDQKEVRLALVSPFGWVLVNEETGGAWTEGVRFPENQVKVDLPLER